MKEFEFWRGGTGGLGRSREEEDGGGGGGGSAVNSKLDYIIVKKTRKVKTAHDH